MDVVVEDAVLGLGEAFHVRREHPQQLKENFGRQSDVEGLLRGPECREVVCRHRVVGTGTDRGDDLVDQPWWQADIEADRCDVDVCERSGSQVIERPEQVPVRPHGPEQVILGDAASQGESEQAEPTFYARPHRAVGFTRQQVRGVELLGELDRDAAPLGNEPHLLAAHHKARVGRSDTRRPTGKNLVARARLRASEARSVPRLHAHRRPQASRSRSQRARAPDLGRLSGTYLPLVPERLSGS